MNWACVRHFAFCVWVLVTPVRPALAQNPCPTDTIGPTQVSILEGIPDGCSQPGEKTWRSPSFDVIEGTWAIFDYPGSDRRFGHTIRNLPAHVLKAYVTLSIKSTSSLSSNDSIAFELTGSRPTFLWSGSIASLVPSDWNTPGEIATLRLDLAALPLPGGNICNVLDYINSDHALDVYLQDDTSVDYIGLDMAVCERDCDGNGVGDYSQIRSFGGDCNNNGMLDSCETFADCNGNNIPDSCEVDRGILQDCDCNGVADSCETSLSDLNGDGQSDYCHEGPGADDDCNGNGIFDRCELAADPSADCNGNGVPDTCEPGSGLTLLCEDRVEAVVDESCRVAVPLQPENRGGCGDVRLDFQVDPPIIGSDGAHTLDAFPPGVFTVTTTATDAAGNTARCSTLVVVEDRQPPVITEKGANRD